MKAAAMIFALCTIPANAEAPEHPSFLQAAIFFAVGLEPSIIKIESDKRATGPLNRYQVSDEDPCVLYDIARAAVEPHLRAVLAGDDPKAIVLDLVQPFAAGGQLISLAWEARRDEPGRKSTLQHADQIRV